ncbi:MAG: SH3 domain-containing protein [Anaerolineales bacterium]|nr:SH3 domain-containing protein [Anaerolineales bacterium]
MARYQIPPDPREGNAEARHTEKANGSKTKASPPWLWIGLGAIVTILAIAVAVLWARLFLDVQPADIEPTPAPVISTATPTSVPPTPQLIQATPTEQQFSTPTNIPVTPEQATAVPLGDIVIGSSVVVIETGVGLNLRAEPVVDPNNILELVQDGVILEVVGGPQEAEGFTWWQVSTPDGIEGWAVQDFLQAQ